MISPLRDRREDIPLLVSQFIKKGNKRENKSIESVDEQGMKRPMEHPWPGNIREFENAVEHAFVICSSNRITLNDLPLEIRENRIFPDNHMSGPFSGTGTYRMDHTLNLTRESLIQLLRENNWNKAEVGRQIR